MQTTSHYAAHKNLSDETRDSTETTRSALIYGQCLGQHTAVTWTVVTEKQHHLSAGLSVL